MHHEAYVDLGILILEFNYILLAAFCYNSFMYRQSSRCNLVHI
jgi:hypothetical protein